MTLDTGRFIRTFEYLKKAVNLRAGLGQSDTFEIDRACEKDRSLRSKRDLLKYMRDVRNMLQHPQHKSDGHAFHITPAFLAEIEGLLDWVVNPPTARSIGVERKDVKVALLTDRLGDLADVMREKGYSHLPVLDEKGAIIGVFNEAAVFDLAWSDDAVIISKSMFVRDVLAYCGLGASRTEKFKFTKPTTPINDLVEMFAAPVSQFTRIGAVFVTSSGKSHEPLQRLITPWDVLISATEGKG